MIFDSQSTKCHSSLQLLGLLLCVPAYVLIVVVLVLITEQSHVSR